MCLGVTCLEATEAKKKKKVVSFFWGSFDPPRQEFLATPLLMMDPQGQANLCVMQATYDRPPRPGEPVDQEHGEGAEARFNQAL